MNAPNEFNVTRTPCINISLQTKVEAMLDRWIKPCLQAKHEHIAVSANDQGEVWLSGLVDDRRTADEAVRMVKGMPGIRYVFNFITFTCTGCPDNL